MIERTGRYYISGGEAKKAAKASDRGGSPERPNRAEE